MAYTSAVNLAMQGRVKDFLRKRGVPEACICRLEEEKIDESVICLMSDEALKEYIPKYGDRIALFTQAKCIMEEKEPSTSTSDKKLCLGDRLRSRINKDPTEHMSRSIGQKGNKNAKKSVRRVEIGWLDYDRESNAYKQVKAPSGGGTKHESFDVDITMKDLVREVISWFFPTGSNRRGPVSDFEFFMTDATHVKVAEETTIQEMYTKTKSKILRLYLASKIMKEKVLVTNKLDSDSDALPDLDTSSASAEHKSKRRKKKVLKLGLAEDLTEEVGNKATSHELEAEGMNTDPCVLQPSPLIFQSCGGSSPQQEALPSATGTDVLVEEYEDQTLWFLSVNNAEAGIHSMSPELTTGAGPFGEHSQPESNERESGVRESSVRAEATLTLSSQLELDRFLPTEGNNLGVQSFAQEHEKVHITLHRSNVQKELLSFFMEEKIVNAPLHVKFIDEAGADAQGVSREAYSAFWKEFFLTAACGEQERVPSIFPDYGLEEWKAVGRILLKGFTDCGIYPIKLAQAFSTALILGENTVTPSMLLDSFFLYLCESDKRVIENALSGVPLDEDEKDDFLDLLSRVECHSIPNEENARHVVLSIAHKELIQEPKYALDAMAKVAREGLQLLLPEVETIKVMYDHKKPTTRKVIKLLYCSPCDQEESSVLSFLKQFIKGLDDSMLRKFLRHCTGAEVICTDKIEVTFNKMKGFGRAPVAHTCGPVLELSSTYTSYTDLRKEFMSILESNFLNMDIM